MNKQKIIICPDSFKGSLSARDAADAIKRGVLRALVTAQTILLPIADGGEGTLDALVPHSNRINKTVRGTNGDDVTAAYGFLGDTAVIEMARAAGLCLVSEENRSAADACTYGVGELILDALERGYRKIMLTVGGSGTNDGGSGMLEALGGKFYGANGEPITHINGRKLCSIAHIDILGVDKRLFDCEFLIACDVTNPLLGETGATRIYGAQKGADSATLDLLEQNMAHYADKLAEIGRDVRDISGCGAGGGLPAPLLALCNAKILSGIDAVLSAQDYENKLDGASLVITGEGKIDRQSAFGKAISGVTVPAAKRGIDVMALVGIRGDGADELCKIGLTHIAAMADIAPNAEYSMTHAAEMLEQLALLEMNKLIRHLK